MKDIFWILHHSTAFSFGKDEDIKSSKVVNLYLFTGNNDVEINGLFVFSTIKRTRFRINQSMAVKNRKTPLIY